MGRSGATHAGGLKPAAPRQTMYTPKQVAEALGVSDQTIYRWIAAGILHATARRRQEALSGFHQ